MTDKEIDQQFLVAEHEVERHSTELKKELRLGDLVLSQILYIVSLAWLGTAGKMGSAHIMFWIPAVLLFYIPSGIVVVHLSEEMPLEGGLYQWAKLRFGDRVGFLVALNLWATMTLILAAQVDGVTSNLAYAAGPGGTWMAESRPVTLAVGILFAGGLMLLARRGLGLVKWIHNVGGFVPLAILGAMLVFAWPRWMQGGAVVAPIAITAPAVSLLNFNLLGKMAFGAFCGFDGMSIFAAEVREPSVGRAIRRSIWLAAPLIALIYIAGTACVLAFSKSGEIDMIAPATQVLRKATEHQPLLAFLAPLAAFLIACSLVCGGSLLFNALIRLPMVAGWDHLLPEWMSRLHPRYKTPTGSILCIGLSVLALTVVGHLGVGSQESFQMLINAGILCWALAYLVMFAIPLMAAGERPPVGVRIAAVSGLVMTLLFVTLSLFPIIEVVNVGAFAAKIGAVVVGLNAAGMYYFTRAKRRRIP